MAAALLTACAPTDPRQQVYHEAAFAPYGNPGSATVNGQAFTVLRDNTVKYQRNSTVCLMPDNPYTQEIGQRIFIQGHKLTPADPRFAKYVVETPTDNKGNFVFKHVHPGKYFVFCDLYFQYDETTTNDDGSTSDSTVQDDQWIYKQITVGSSQTVSVTDWNQGH